MATQVAPLAAGHPAGFPALHVAGPVVALQLFIPTRVRLWDEDPISQARPRARVQVNAAGNAYAQVYTHPRTREWEAYVVKALADELRLLGRVNDGRVLRLPLTRRLIIATRFNLRKPKGTPAGETVPETSRGDVDNMAKSILDAMQTAKVISNDSRVTDLYSYRRWADDLHPCGVEVDITGRW